MKSPGILTTKEDGSIDYKIINEWQLCPKCEGHGSTCWPTLINTGPVVCDLCNGKKIISKVNGLPPDQ